MQFTIRDLLWVMALAGVCLSGIWNHREGKHAAAMSRLRVEEINRDMHEHLYDFGGAARRERERLDDNDTLWQQAHGIIHDHEKRIDAIEKAEPTP